MTKIKGFCSRANAEKFLRDRDIKKEQEYMFMTDVNGRILVEITIDEK